MTAGWDSTFPGGTLYYAQLSTNATFAAPLFSSNTLNLSASFAGLTPNTTYYAQVATAPAGPFTSLGSAVTLMQPPSAVYFDEITTHSIVASAYAPTPAFSNLNAGLSGTNVARDGVYAGWHGERWTTKTAMPTARYGLQAAAVNGRLYAIGGYNGTSQSTNAEYDPVTDSWAAKTAMPTARHSFALAVLGGKVYAAGGENTGLLATHQQYDPATNAWTTKTALPSARTQAAPAVFDGRIHVFGGTTGINLGLQDAYDPATNAWQSKTAMPDARNSMGIEVVDGKAFLIGGEAASLLAYTRTFDFAANSYANRSTMAVGRGIFAHGIIGGKIYVAGGRNGSSSWTGASEEYDPAADAWTARAEMPTARRWMGSAVIAGRLYVVGGSSNTTLAVNEQYDPGVAQQFTGLSPNTLYTFKAKARNLAGVETDQTADYSTYTWAAAPTGAALAPLGPSSAAFTWSAGGNPSGTQFQAELSLSTSFTSPTLTGWGADLSSAVFGALSAGTTYYARVQARNAVGVPSGYAALASTQTLPPPPPELARFTSPLRRLLPGTTVASAFGDPVSSALDVELFNSIGGLIASTWAFHTVLVNSTDSPTMRAGTDPSRPIADGSDWPLIGPSDTPLSVAIPPGQTRARFYVWNTAVGVKGLQAVVVRQDGFTMPTATQSVIIEVGLSSAGFAAVSLSSLTVNWGSDLSTGTPFYAVVSTNAAFTPPLLSSNTLNLSATFTGLVPNTTYYAQVATAPAGPFTALGSTVTLIQPPSAVYFDEITTHSIVASAYAPTPAFSNLNVGLSGTNLARDGVYAGWHGERWTAKAAMPTARYGLQAAAVNGRLYAIGGYNGGNLSTNAEYDPAVDAWTAKAAMTTARHSFGIAVAAGKVYAFGGESTSMLSVNQEYDPAANSWTTKAAAPAAYAQIGAVLFGGRIHAFGGSYGVVVSSHVSYDPVGNSWQTHSQMPDARQEVGVEVINGKAYVIGGEASSMLGIVREHEFAAGTWVSKSTMPTARGIFAHGVIGGKIYALGGRNAVVASRTDVSEEYDPAVDTWTVRTAMPAAREWMGSAVVAGRLYVIGGSNGSALATNEEYDPGVAQQFIGLAPNTQYSFKAKARNLAGVETGESADYSTYTLAAVPVGATPTVTGVFVSSVSLAWTANGNPAGTEYRVSASTAADFNAAASSQAAAWSTALSVDFPGLAPNTTWHFRVQARNAVGVETSYAALGSAVTWMQPPSAVYFDEITTHSIVASAYAPTPAFSNLNVGLSGTNLARDGVYAGWHGEKWTAKAAMPTARYGVKAAAVNGRIYAVGGYNGTSQSTNAEYDPVADAWTAKTAMPTARHSFALAALGGKLYAAGGENTGLLATHQEYDPAADAWTTKTSLPSARTQAGSAVFDGRLHLFGGTIGTSLALQDAYDPATNAWQSRTAMPDARNSMGVEVVGGKAYLIGGETASLLAYNKAFDLLSDSWVDRSTMPIARAVFAHGLIGGKIYAVGGKIGAPPGTDAAQEYDPAADTWTARTSGPTKREWMGSAVVAGRLYVIGGSNGTALAVNEEYDPGVAQPFTGLQPNTLYTFKAKARNLHGLETAETAGVSTYTWAAVPTGAALAPLGPSSAAFTWSAGGNPSGTQFQAELSLSTSFASPALTGWGADLSSAVFGGLSGGTTYYARVQARNAVGVPSGYAAVLSTRTPYAAVAGCGLVRDVAKAGAPYATLTAALAAVPAALTVETCVVVRDSGTYAEQVVVRGKDTGGFRLRIEAGAGARPVLSPPAGSTAGLRVENSSVTVSGLAVVTTNTVAYGIVVSSPQVTLTSVSVDSGGKISGAGIFLSSGGALAYSSITVQNADGVRVTGSSNAIAFTTASVGAFSRGAFYLNGASSTTLQDSFGYGNPGYGAFLYHSHRNTLARNILRKVSATAGAAGLYLNDASSNVVTDCSVSNANGTGADLAVQAHWNVVELSTVTASGSSYDALLVGSGRGTRVSRVYVQSAAGNAASFSSGSSESVVEHSTFVADAAGFRALGTNGSSETITSNLLLSPNGTGLGLFGSSITVSLTTGVTASASYPALYIAGGGYVTLRDSSFQNSAGDGGKLERTAYVEILRSTVAGAGGGAGLRLEGASSNTVTASRLAAPGGVGLSVGSYLELFDMTTTTGSGNAFFNLEVSGSTGAAISASRNVSLASSTLVGDGSGTGLLLGAENSGTLSLSSLTIRGAAAALGFANAVVVATVTGVAIDASAAFSAEGSALLAGSRITVRDATGAHGGSLYEDDPLGVVDWVPDAVPFVPPPAPAAPSGTALGPTAISWAWAPVAGAESYRVRGSSDLTPWAAPADTGVVLAGLSPNSTYSIVVAGFAHYLAGPLSLPGTAHTLAAPPTGLAPLFVTASSAALQWGLNGNPPGSFAEISRSSDGTAFAVRAGTLATTAYDASLLGCTSYYYRVRNRNPAGLDTDFAGPLLVRTPASTPAAPGDLSAQSIPGRSVTLTWNPSATEGIVAYRLYKDSGAGQVDYSAPYAQFSGTVFSTTTVALSSGVLHLFGLRAVHRCGIEEPNTHAVASAWALESLDGVRAGIKVPASGKKISGNRVLVMAELDTGDPRDVSSILFQYRSTGSATWTDIPAANANHPNPDREQPFFVHWDVTGLADRAYDLRAVASDVVGASDPAPGTITVLVDSVGFEVRETDLGGGRVKKEQAVSNETANTVAAAGSGSAVVTKVVLPAGALNTADATLSATPNPAALPAPPADATSLGASIEITLSNGQSLLSGGQTAAIVFNYPDDDGDGVIDGTAIRAENAQIQTFDTAANAWKQEFATAVDKDKRTLTGRTPHFSLFAAFGVQAANLDAIRVYPNPYKPNGGNADEGRPFSRGDPLSGVVFDNLPAVVDIKIYTLTGRLVSSFGTSSGTGALQWDGKNDQGEDVASGGYFAVITSPGASTVVKKIGVIR